VAATLVLRQAGIPVYASDKAADPDGYVGADGIERLKAAGAAVQLGGHDLDRIRRAGLVVVSPGVPPDAPPLEAARGAGVPLVSEVDVGYHALPGVKYAAITGTNGKSTTTALAAHLLQSSGFNAVAAGNIGKPLSQVALDGERPEWIALELSSFQLHDTRDLVPAVGAITNLAPDHLDRYPSVKAYYADKDRLFLHANPASCWVLNGDDAEVLRRAQGIKGTQLRFRLAQDADAWFDRANRTLMLKGERLLERDGLPLLGDHNVANALCASLIAWRAGGAPPRIAAGLRTFESLHHRMEPIRTVGGVLWINDSKATNVASTLVAVQAMDRPFVLLLGGRHKGEPYTVLADAAKARCRAVIAFGESREIVKQDLADRLPVTLAGTDFTEVLRLAGRLAQSGDAVLLSPACSSYDMFRNYEDRGAQFRAAVEAL
jgi:UDP-N-acetylmuramoylalanine--D-glutamate ligase